jgi:hypothetical protein
VTQVFPPLNYVRVLKVTESPDNIFVHNNNLYYNNDKNGDIICYSTRDTKVSNIGYWFSDKIPPPPFDISQRGNRHKD